MRTLLNSTAYFAVTHIISMYALHKESYHP